MLDNLFDDDVIKKAFPSISPPKSDTPHMSPPLGASDMPHSQPSSLDDTDDPFGDDFPDDDYWKSLLDDTVLDLFDDDRFKKEFPSVSPPKSETPHVSPSMSDTPSISDTSHNEASSTDDLFSDLDDDFSNNFPTPSDSRTVPPSNSTANRTAPFVSDSLQSSQSMAPSLSPMCALLSLGVAGFFLNKY
jgi:hypothetical protein